MKKIINLTIAIIFTFILTGTLAAQETPLIPQIPKEIPKPIPQPTPPTESANKLNKDSTESEGEDYDVPFIGKENLKEGKAKLSAEIEELTAEASIEANEDGTTQLKISMSNVDKIAKGRIYFVWLTTSEGKYSKIGEVSYSETSKTAEIGGKVPLDTFGVFITVEVGKVEKPTSKSYAAFKQESEK